MKESKKACNHAYFRLPSLGESSAFCGARVSASTMRKLRLAMAAVVFCGIGFTGGMEKADAYVAGSGSIVDDGRSGSGIDDPENFGIAIGTEKAAYKEEGKAEVIGLGGVSIGNKTKSYSGCIAIGSHATSGNLYIDDINLINYCDFYCVAIGSWAQALKEASVALGEGTYGNGLKSVSIGYAARVYDDYSVAIGADAVVSYKSGSSTSNSVALGANSTAEESYVVSVGRAQVGNEGDDDYVSAITRKIQNVGAGLADTDATTFAQIKTDENGSYIKKSLTNSTTLNAEGTVGKNLTALDNAIGKVETPTSGKLYVIGESLSSGSLANSVSANLLALDQKVGEITSNYGILNKDNTISQNLMALEAAIAKANQTLDFSNPDGTATTNSTTNGVTNGSTTNGTTNGTTNSGTTTSSTTIYSNNGTPIAKIAQGTVSKNDTGFVSGGQVWNADVAAGQNVSFSSGSNVIKANDGTVLATFTKMENVSAGDNGFVSGSDLYNEVRPEDGKYVKNNSTTGDNLNALDDAVAALDKKTEGLISTDDGTGTDGGSGTGGTIHIGGGSSADNVTIINISKSDGTPRTLTGVADGVNDYDAVNMRQYNALSTDVRAVAAGSAALAALHPGTYNPDDKMSFAVGFGHYKDANAGALGAFYKPNEDTMISVAGTVGNGNPMWNLGLSFKLGERGIKAKTYRDGKELTRDMNSLQKDSAEQAAKIKTLEADKNLCTKKNDAQDKKIAAQEKMINLQAKEISALKADNEKMKAQIAQILKKVELSSTVKKTAAAH